MLEKSNFERGHESLFHFLLYPKMEAECRGGLLKEDFLTPGVLKIQTGRDSEPWKEGCWWSPNE